MFYTFPGKFILGNATAGFATGNGIPPLEVSTCLSGGFVGRGNGPLLESPLGLMILISSHVK